MLLAAGYGSRLRPLTDTIPKCLVPIKSQPLLDIWLESLTQAEIGPFIINTHYLNEQVEAYIKYSKYYNQVTLVYEENLLGTAGTLITNLDFFQNRDCMLIHADNYSMADLNAFKKAHKNRPPECLMTMMTFRTQTPSTCGIVEIDKRGVVIGFHEKVANPPGNLANGAVYILSDKLLKKLAKDLSLSKDFSKDVLNQLLGKIYSHEIKDVFLDIGTPQAYKAANKL
jgi:mannose-1-phosphate guanylyltransferase